MAIYFKPRIAALLIGLAFQVISCTNKQNTNGNTVASRAPLTDMEKGFITPPDSVKPSIYWYWMSDNISKEGVVRDLEAMNRIGIGRAFIGNIGYPKEEVPYGNVKMFSDEWWNITEEAIRKASALGIDIGMFNSPGWSQSGGPWIKPSQAMRYMASSELLLKGPEKISRKLPAPGEDFQDVVVLAFPAPEKDAQTISAFKPVIITTPAISDIKNLTDGKVETAAMIPASNTKPFIIDLEVKNNFTARSLVLYPAAKPFRADVELQVSEGNTYRTVEKFVLDRSNPNLHVGFKPYGPVAVSFPATEGKKFRLVLTNVGGSSGLAEIELSGAPRVERYIEKQLAKMFQTPLPLWNEYQWPVQPEPENKALTIAPAKVINISEHLSADGTLNWQVPAGNWVVLRYGMLPTGVTNGPASPEGIGLEVDKMNVKAVEDHFGQFIGKVLDRMPAEERKALKWVVADSYETGSQNWTDGFAAEFKEKYGYDPFPWLPVLTGRVVGAAEQSNRFLWDVRRLVADGVAYKYVGGLRDISNKHGLKIWLENYGHWGFPGEFLQYGGQSDEIGGEFWNEGDLGSVENRAASSAVHIYGKTKVSAESFTAGGLAYVRYPAMLKKRGDWSFTEGVNNTLLHVFITQPYEDRNPGVNAGFGTEFNRKNTWFEQSKMFVDYLRRCNFMLQQGKPVNDVAYFIGEDAPKMTGVRDPEIPQGYSYDYINAEVIINRLSVKDGKLVLPDGMSYHLLVLPKLETMRPEVLRKIKDLVAAGGSILGPAPLRSPSLENYPAADNEVKKLAAELWGNVNGNSVKSGKFGKGNVFAGMDLQTALDRLQVVPDFKLGENKPVLFVHRSTKGEDIYFVTNQSDQEIELSPAFRVTGKQPEFWDAVTGSTPGLPVFTQQAKSTVVPLKLKPLQSGFIVFRKSATQSASTLTASNFPEPQLVKEVTGPWQVVFEPGKRGPEQPVVFNELADWAKHTDDKIKYFSGTAVYHNTFKPGKIAEGQRVYLDLGEVKAMAKVKLNGVDVGGAWTAPWRVDITDVVKPGENKLEIEVVNTWVNRLIGDSKLPANERNTWSNVNLYKPDSPLESSGLMGPVKVTTIKYAMPVTVQTISKNN